MRTIVFAVIASLWLGGCLVPAEETPSTGPADPSAQAVQRTYFLKGDHRLSLDPPAKPSPDRVPANPMINGFANEDLRAFASERIPAGLNITRVHLVAFYEVAAPTIDPFPNASSPTQARQIVFWIGSRGIYPASVSTMGDTVLVPGRVYRAEADLPLPRPGWIVPAGEPLQFLVATLAVNDRGAELRFLVDARDTPSRIEITGTASSLAVPATLHPVRQPFEVLGNSGMFTGATADRVPSKVRVPIEVRPTDAHVEVRVIFGSNAGGKSDLDFDLFAPDGRPALSSSTPYQSEWIRMFPPNLAFFGAGTYQAEIVAYSGTSTRFSVETSYAQPR